MTKNIVAPDMRRVVGAANINIPPLDLKGAGVLTENPDRGLRMEVYITLGKKLSSYPRDGKDPFAMLDNMVKKYKDDRPRIVQTYVYLSNYYMRPLDELAFSQLHEYFLKMKSYGIKMLLRFTYLTEEKGVKDAGYFTVKSHLKSIGKWFSENRELAFDTVYAVQLGIIGLWGEGHTAKRFKMIFARRMIRRFMEAIPEELFVETRTMALMDKFDAKYSSRVGIHDDYIIGDMSHEWAFLPDTDPRFNELMKRVKYTLNDGEMPWGREIMKINGESVPADNLDGIKIAEQLAAYSLTTFSMEHNNTEDPQRVFTMPRWRKRYIEPKSLDLAKLYLNPFLVDTRGKISVFDAIKYHLGYQLFLSDYSYKDNLLRFRITNYGFAAPLYTDKLEIVYIDNGEEKSITVESYDRYKLMSRLTYEVSALLPNKAYPYGVRLSSSNGNYSVRFANNTPFVKGVQLFKGYKGYRE